MTPLRPSYPPGETLRRAGCAVAVVGILAAIVVQKLAEGRQSLLWSGVAASADLLTVIAALGFAAWIIGTLRNRRVRR